MDPALWELIRARKGSPDGEIAAIIRLRDPDVVPAGVRLIATFGAISTCRIPLSAVPAVRSHENTISLKAPRPLGPEPQLELAAPQGWHALAETSATPDHDSARDPADRAFNGAGVIVGVVDWGCDFDHPNFKLANGRTRLLALWDQRGGPGPASPAPYGYGRLHDRARIDEAIASGEPYRALGYHPADADSIGTGAHGTHVMDIAAGNGRAGGPVGAAPQADLVFVHLDSDPLTRRLGNLGDSSRILESLHFIAELAARHRRPWVVNLSVGRSGGPHDGTTLLEMAVDELLGTDVGQRWPARAVCQSAGNYRDAGTHSCGRLDSTAAQAVRFEIDPDDRTPNELEVWYSGRDEFEVEIRSPSGTSSGVAPLDSRHDVVEGGRVVGRLYHRRDDPANHDHHVDLFLDGDAPPGRWTLRLTPVHVVDGGFHAWLERDDAKAENQARFVDEDAVASHTLGTLANSRRALVVGAYDARSSQRLAGPFSSAGPTRDGRMKPDLAADGVCVNAARSSGRDERSSIGALVRKSGTSMATPRVTGAAALCLQAGAATGEVRELVIGSVDQAPTADRSLLGAGYLDLDRLVAQLTARSATPAATRAASAVASAAATADSDAGAAWPKRARPTLHLSVVDEHRRPISAGSYAIHQGGRVVSGALAGGPILAEGVDPALPFIVEVLDRVCAIEERAFLDPDDAALQYGGTWFDWTAVRDGRSPETRFWPPYRAALDAASAGEAPAWAQRGVDRLWQHEHLVRRQIRAVPGSGTASAPVVIRAVPTQIRTGPVVRHTDANSTSVWIETVTPAMIRMRTRRPGSQKESVSHTSTVRVGGRYFAVAEMTGLDEDTAYEWTLDAVPLPATGPIPVEPANFAKFAEPTAAVAASIGRQLQPASIAGTRWMQVRTLRRRYERLRFITGSCRWYPGDVIGSTASKPGKDWGPDMLDRLGAWLRTLPPADRPHFQFYGGDQIYADEIGDGHATAIVRGRFASRIPGPADPQTPVARRLIDGSWAGRFAHRLAPLRELPPRLRAQVDDNLKKLDALLAEHEDLRRIASRTLTEEQLRRSYETVSNRRLFSKARTEASDELRYRRALAALPAFKALLVTAEPFRVYRPYWSASHALAQRAPDAARFRSINFLLWSVPDSEHDAPTLSDQSSAETGLRGPGGRGHRSVDRGRHAADFAEYALLYERAWTTTPNVRTLLANLPTFLMLDDHEVTDDWNFDARWVRLVHSKRDHYRMWPKTITDALCAYWIYQGLGNRLRSAWQGDPRGEILLRAQREGTDALGRLREVIHAAVMADLPADPRAPIQAGLGLDWHYQLPIEPPFLVPDCRTRKRLDPHDDQLRVIDHASRPPRSETIDAAQIAWMRRALMASSSPVALIAPSSPLLLQNAVTTLMTKPETAARTAIDGFDLAGIAALATGSSALGMGSNELLRTFRRRSDLEHIVRDKSWRDLWGLIDGLGRRSSPLKTLVLVSGDVHHSYCMTATSPKSAGKTPTVVQITSSGLRTTIRSGFKEWLADKIRFRAFDFDGRRLALHPLASAAGEEADVIYSNAAALVHVDVGNAGSVRVTHFAGLDNGKVRSYRFATTASSQQKSPFKGGEELDDEQLAEGSPARRPACRDGGLSREQYRRGIAWLLHQAMITSEEASRFSAAVPDSRAARCRVIDALARRSSRGREGTVTPARAGARVAHLITSYSVAPTTIAVDSGEAARIEFDTTANVSSVGALIVKFETSSERPDHRSFPFTRPVGHHVAVWDGTFDGSRNRPPEPGTFRIRVSARDRDGNTEERFAQITVVNASRKTVLPRTQSGLAVATICFDGGNVVLADEAGNSISARAISGLKVGHRRNREGLDFTQARYQDRKDRGPIPSGVYFIDANAAQIPSLRNGALVYPSGGTAARWGPFRAPLRPDSATATYGRSDFFLHLDVHNDGTAGCIGVQTVDMAKLNQMMALLLRVQPAKPVRVEVDYPQ